MTSQPYHREHNTDRRVSSSKLDKFKAIKNYLVLAFEPSDAGEVLDRPEYKKIHIEYRNLVSCIASIISPHSKTNASPNKHNLLVPTLESILFT